MMVLREECKHPFRSIIVSLVSPINVYLLVSPINVYLHNPRWCTFTLSLPFDVLAPIGPQFLVYLVDYLSNDGDEKMRFSK